MEMTPSSSISEKKIMFTAYTLNNSGEEEIIFEFAVTFTPNNSVHYTSQVKASKDTILKAHELGATVRMKGSQNIINDICGISKSKPY